MLETQSRALKTRILA